jgi:hypothetical protein
MSSVARHPDWVALRRLLLLYVPVVIAAALFDLGTDRNLGALPLSAIPVSAVAAIALIFSTWAVKHRRGLFVGWMLGAGLVLVLTQVFGMQGPEQAKVAETVGTYAGVVMALPASIAAVAVLSSEEIIALMPSETALRMLCHWLAFVAAAIAQWFLGVLIECALRRHALDL